MSEQWIETCRCGASIKLTGSDIPKIREMLSDGIPQAAIAERFSVCQNTISNIKHRRWWKHVA